MSFLHSPNRASSYIYVRKTDKMHTFSHQFIPIKLYSTCFEQLIVHHQEVIPVHAAFSILPCIYGSLAANTMQLELMVFLTYTSDVRLLGTYRVLVFAILNFFVSFPRHFPNKMLYRILNKPRRLLLKIMWHKFLTFYAT